MKLGKGFRLALVFPLLAVVVSCTTTISQHTIDWISNSDYDYSILETREDSLEFTLLMAAGENEMELVQELINSGVDVNAEDRFGWTALHYATREGYLDLVRYLISQGADINKRGRTSVEGELAGYWQPLHLSAHNGRLAITNYFLD